MMDLRVDESVLDFDLQLLHQLPLNNVPRTTKCPKDKQRMALYLVKSKTIATDSVIRKYHAAKETLDQTQRALYTSMEECKQICIDQRNSLDKCASLEENVKSLQKQNYELEQKAINLENRCEGLMCHTNQLQVLVKEYETQIEGFKIENKLDVTNEKESEKKYEAVKKEKSALLKDIGILVNIILGKKKPDHKEKRILEKYKSHSKFSADDIDDVFDDALSHSFSDDSVDNSEEVQKKSEPNPIKDADSGKLDTENCDNVSDSHDLISIDTGRGSSIAFSGSEKCFLSPDYFSADSPSPEVFEPKTIKKVNVATSPPREVLQVDRCLSPIFGEKENVRPNTVDRAVSPCNITEIVTMPPCSKRKARITSMTSPDCLTTCDSSTSPIKDLVHNNSLSDQIEDNIPRITIDKVASPLRVIKNDKAPSLTGSMGNVSPTTSMRSLSPLTFDHNDDDSSDTMLLCDETTNPKIDFHDILTSPSKESTNIKWKETVTAMILQEKECLELNSSCKMFKQQTRDEEIETILEEMRLTRELVTPIPKSPAKSHKSKKRETITVKSCENSNNCLDAAKMREENKALHVTVASLVKEVLNIKTLLKSHWVDDIASKPPIENSPQECKGSKFNGTTNPEVPTHDFSSLPPSELFESTNIFDDDENVADASTTFSTPNNFENSPKENCVPDNIHFEDDHESNCDLAIDERPDEDIVMEDCKEKAAEIQKDKRVTRKKLTKLDKLRNNLLPRHKIKSSQPPSAKGSRLKLKKLTMSNVKEIKGTSAETLNDKVVYEKAVKVMAELNAKKKTATPNKDKKLSKYTEIVKEIDNSEMKSSKLDARTNIEDSSDDEPLRISVNIRSRKKIDVIESEPVRSICEIRENEKTDTIKPQENVVDNCTERVNQRRGVKRASIDTPDIERKRSLRSSTVAKLNNTVAEMTSLDISEDNIQSASDKLIHSENQNRNNNNSDTESKMSTVCKTQQCKETSQKAEVPVNPANPHDNVLCTMIQKYGLNKIKYVVKKVSDKVIESTAKKIDEGIAKIIELPVTGSKSGMDKLVDEMKKWNIRTLILGLIKYLHDPARKQELFSKVACPPAPPMTKSEQILLYIVTQLRSHWPDYDFVILILDSIEYSLFKLNRSPDFDVIESMAHFYAVLCRYIKAKNRLRIFVMDAMYCIQFKSIPLIKQCIDVWMHILPLAHMGVAKSPLVTCLVYLLHFFKCEDRFNRVQEIRYILKQKYFYQVTDWNETKILELFKNAILEIRENKDEKKMLRMALILLSKRQGPKWCQNNIIRNILLPLIDKEDVSARVKEFCVSLVGPLLKPYPVEMRVHCEITINQITDILNQNPSTTMEEAIYTSLIYMSKHNPNRVLKALLQWKPKVMSTDMENILKDFVREKPVKYWKTTLSRLPQ